MVVTLPLRRWGRGPEPLLFVHGFTGTGAAFDHLEPLLGAHVSAAAVDLPGHGACAPPTDKSFGWNETVEAIASALDRAHGGPAHLAGYSLGARLSLAVALRYPRLVRSLLLESGSPGLHKPEDRAARTAGDAELAAQIERDGTAAFVDRWEKADVLSGLQKLPTALGAALRARRLAQSPAGLAWSLRKLGTGSQPDLWPALRDLRTPALLVHGSRDDKFRAFAEKMALRIPDANLREIRRTGHAPHLEAPAGFAAAVLDHLAARRAQAHAEAAHGAPATRDSIEATTGSQP